MGFLRDMQVRVNFTSRGAGGLSRDVSRLRSNIDQLDRIKSRRSQGNRAMAISYGAEQAATQLQRVSNFARRGLEDTAGLAASFEDQMARVSAKTAAGASRGQQALVHQNLTRKARELGSTTRYTAIEAAEGMELLAMAGMGAEKQMKTIPAVLSLATIGNAQVSKSADIATNIMGGFEIEADKAASVIDRMAAALVGGNVNLQELGQTMSHAAPIAKGLGQELESMLGWSDVLGDAGIKGGKAGTGIKAILGHLATPRNKGARAVFESYGIERVDEEGNLRDATDIMSELGLAMARSGKGGAELQGEVTGVFGKRFNTHASVLLASGAKGLAAQGEDLGVLEELLGSSNLNEDARSRVWEGSLQHRIEKVRDSDGLANKMAADIEATTMGEWRAFKSAMQEVGIVLGEQVLPILIDLMDDFKPLVVDVAQWAKKHPALIQGLAGTAMGLVALSAVAAPALHLVSAVAGLRGLGSRASAGFAELGVDEAALIGGGGGRRGGSGFGEGPGGRGGHGRRSVGRTMYWEYGPEIGPKRRSKLELQSYGDRRQGFGVDGAGRSGWSAGNSPDGVWASAQSEYTRRQRERKARRGSRLHRWRRGLDPTYRVEQAAQQAALRKQHRERRRLDRKQARWQRRADRRFQRKANGLKSVGGMTSMASAGMAFAVGTMIGEGINKGMQSVLGKSATDYFDGWFKEFEGTQFSSDFQEWQMDRLGIEVDPEAVYGPTTDVRGSELLSTLNGPTAEGQAAEAKAKGDRDLARSLGVTRETLSTMRAEGFTESDLGNEALVHDFVRQVAAEEQAKAKAEKGKARIKAVARREAQEARALATQEGMDGETAAKVGNIASKRVMGESTGLMGAISSAVARGIQDGVSKSEPLKALLPASAEPVPTG